MNGNKRIIFLPIFFLFLLIPLHLSPRSANTAAAEVSPPTAGEPRSSAPISEYDAVFQTVASEENLDWRLVSAIAYNESRYRADVVSPRGATGLMQVMPATARAFDVPVDRLKDPETNVRVAVKLLREIERVLRFSADTPAEERHKMMLASYNGGIGHVMDARRLAEKYGADPDKWDDVAKYLKLKAQPRYAADEVVDCGVFRGASETLRFVAHVSVKYDDYRARIRA